MSLDEVKNFEIPAEVSKRARISLTSSIFAYPRDSVKFSGEYTGTHVQALPTYSRAQVQHRHRGRSVVCAREKTRALPSLPALTCRPFFFVPPAYRARFFKATHVLSMCDMPLKRHETEGDTRVRCVCVSTLNRCHILMYTYTRGVSPKRRRKEKKREKEKEIHKVTFYLRIF